MIVVSELALPCSQANARGVMKRRLRASCFTVLLVLRPRNGAVITEESAFGANGYLGKWEYRQIWKAIRSKRSHPAEVRYRRKTG